MTASQKRINRAVNGSQTFRDNAPRLELDRKPASIRPVRPGRKYFAPSWMF